MGVIKTIQIRDFFSSFIYLMTTMHIPCNQPFSCLFLGQNIKGISRMFKDMGRAPKATKVYKCKTQPSHHFPMWIWCGLRVNTMGVQGRNPLMWHTSHMHVSKTSYRANKATYVAQWNGTSTRTCLHKTMSKTP